MWLFYLITGSAVFFFFRFFILNSLLTPAARKATLIAALKAAYFAPLFFQGLMLLWLAVVHFLATCKGFLGLFNHWVYGSEVDDVYGFLYLLSYMVSSSLALSLHFILCKISLNKKTGPLNIFFKAAYLAAAFFILKVMLLNAGLAHPIAPLLAPVVVFINPYVIIATVLALVVIITFSFFNKNQQSGFRYLQLGAFISSSYIVVCILISVVLFFLYAACSTIG